LKWRLARKAYLGYRSHTGGKSLGTGQPIPDWDDLPDVNKDAWLASITAIQEDLCNEISVEISNVGYDVRQRLMNR